jgi:serine phosphatase RsbU (regulator of sigma subunit)
MNEDSDSLAYERWIAVAQAGTRSESGDCVRVASRRDGRELFFIADVAGHDARAASVARQIDRCVFDLARSSRPAALLSLLNAMVEERWPSDVFVCAVCFALDARTGEGSIACAGQLPPVVKGARRCRAIDVEGEPPLGIVPGYGYGEEPFTLAPGELLVAATDGVTDPLATRNDLLGLSALARLVEWAPPDPNQLCATLLRAAQRAGIQDDATVLAVAPGLRAPSVPGIADWRSGPRFERGDRAALALC